MRAKRRRRRERRRLSWLRFLLGLAALASILGLGIAALLGGRRRDGREEEARGGGGELDDWDEPRPARRASPAPPDKAPVESPAIWFAGPSGNLYLRDTGEADGQGPTVLFIHSLAGNGGQWSLQLDHLRGRGRALALDLRGHGDSDPAEDGDYSVSALAKDVAAAANLLALRRFVVAGHSLGGAVAIEYASLHPERVAGLLLVDPNGDQTRVPAAQMQPFLEALRADPHGELERHFRQLVVGGDPHAARWVLDDLQLTHEDAIVRGLESSLHHAPLPALAAYPGPRLSVISEMNSLPFSLHNLLPDLPTRLLPGTGHWLMLDRPGDFNRILDEFLDEVE